LLFDTKAKLDGNINGLYPGFYGRIISLNPVAGGGRSNLLYADPSVPQNGIATVK
jgi:hypothetical protein|tara:strand:+ start:405 stop:569 length:165 start_codon:yes stop_codon:yes gene_type:complete